MEMEILKNTLERNKEKYITYLKDLIKCNTQHINQGIGGGFEANGQVYIENLMREIGFNQIEKDPMKEEVIQYSIKNYHEGNENHDYTNRYNLYATYIGTSEEKKKILFNGHMDTMPPGPLNLWNTDPLTPVIKDGYLFGLGAADMKSGLMAAILSIQLLKDAELSIPNDVIIASVCDEEGGGNGSVQAVFNAPKSDAVIVCEPTNYELIIAHMGFVFFRVETTGLSHHSGSKWKGVSAIEKMSLIIERLKMLEYEWLFRYKHPLLPPPNINFGVLEGGSSGATVPGYCKLEVCIHYHPNTMTHENVVKEFNDSIESVCESDNWLKIHRPKITLFQAGGGFEMNEKSDLVDISKKVFTDIHNKEMMISGSPAGCDSRLWRNIANCPTIQYGPGRLEECHSPNEYVSLQQFLDAILFYAKIILDFGKEE